MSIVGNSGGGRAGSIQRIRLGIVGDGDGAFIGAVHCIAARLADRYELMAGAPSSTPERSRRSGAALGLDPARCYGDLAGMAAGEARREGGAPDPDVAFAGIRERMEGMRFVAACLASGRRNGAWARV